MITHVIGLLLRFADYGKFRHAPHKVERVDSIVSSFIRRGSTADALYHLNLEVQYIYIGLYGLIGC